MSTGLLIPHIRITRLVRELHEKQQQERLFPTRMRSNDPDKKVLDGEKLSRRWQASALMAVHEMAEHLLVMYFNTARTSRGGIGKGNSGAKR
jgi:histone H3/H4